jgi:DTW domain-containing protein YfiP
MMKHCLCSSIKPFETKARFVILIHPKELKKEKAATGRLTKLSLKNSELIDGVDFTDDRRVNQLIQDPKYFPMLLYPGDESYNLSEGIFPKEILQDKTLLIFIIDGTWACAKKMMRLSTNLHSLPRLSFTNNQPSEFLIKHQPHPSCLSTIESTSFLIDELNRVGLEQTSEQAQMLVVFREMIDFFIKCANDPNLKSYRGTKGYKLPSERKPNLLKRRLFFES